jgi:PAS domain S-box-containing protein
MTMATMRLHAAADGPHPVNDQLRLVLDAMPTLVWLAAPDGAAVYLGQRWLEYTGLSAELAGGWGWTTAVHQDDIDRLTTHWQALLASGAQGEIKARLRRFDGQYRWCLFSAAPLHEDSGRLTGWCVTNIDIEEQHHGEEVAREDRKRAEDARRSGERQLQAIIDNIPAFIAIHNGSGELELENRAALEYHEGGVADMKQWQASDIAHPDDMPALIAAHQRALATGQPVELEQRLRRADGAYRWFHIRSRQSRDDYDGASRWYTVGTDIHDRKMAEDALRRSETFLLEVQRLSRSGGWRYDVATDRVESSTEIQRAHAVQPGEDISRPPFWFGRIHLEDRPRVQAQFEASVREKTEYQAGYRIVLPDGSIRYQYATGHPVTNDAGDLVEFIGAIMDMTEHWLATSERTVAEEALRKSEERWRAVFENSAIGVALTDQSGRFLATNSAFQKMLGYTDEEIGTLTFLEITHEDYRESNWQLVAELLEGKRRQFQIEKQYRRKDGRFIWVSNNVSVVPGSKSMPRFLMALSEDITERKQTEETLRRTQAELAHVARVASLGEMTASIAHEVNQPLAAVVANGHACLRWLSASPPNVPKAVEAAERIVKDGKDAGEVVRRVRALFKRTAIERVRLDLDEVIGEVLRLLDSYPARKHVSLEAALAPDLPPVFADRVQLQQLLLNLMLNALEALEPVSGRVKQLTVRTTHAEGQRAAIQISDNGMGLDDSVAAFEPFVTTKPEGMGLGLAICRSIVAAHEGTLSAERNVGFGTTFTVTLPAQPVEPQ